MGMLMMLFFWHLPAKVFRKCYKYVNSFFTDHSMLFSTDPNPSKSKTECLIFSRDKTAEQIMKVKLNGDFLPWVGTAKHLGNHLSSKLDLATFSPETKTDLLAKRAILFDKVHQVEQQFGYYEPQLVLRLLSIYSTALYGSPLWQLYSDEHCKLNRSWNTAVKISWDLPHSTHTRFLESLCPVTHLESVLTGRAIGFLQNLENSKKELIRLLFNSCSADLRTVTGRNLNFLLLKYGKATRKELFDDRVTIKHTRVYTLPAEENWKVSMMEEISLMKKNHLDIEFDKDALEEILEYICTD